MDTLSLFSLLLTVCVDYAFTQDDRPSILCANRTSILRVDLETLSSTKVVTGSERSVAVDYHYTKGLVIWTDVETEKIYSISLGTEPSNKKILVDTCVTPDGVAVDWIHDNLYWTDAEKDVVAVAHLDDSFKHKTLVDRDLLEPRAIVLHPQEGLMFWTDWGRTARIERAGLDGSQRTAIVTKGIRWPNGLAIDLDAQRIYWIDGSTKILSSSNYDGKEERVIISSEETLLRHPFSLDILGEWLYWTEWSTGIQGLYKTSTNNSNQERPPIGPPRTVGIFYGAKWNTLMGIKIYSSTKQPAGLNRCFVGGCTHLCLPSPGRVKYSCACMDGVLPSDNCSTTPRGPFLNSASENQERVLHEISNVLHIPVGLILLLTVIAIVAVAGISFFAYRIYSRRTRSQTGVTYQGWTGIDDNQVYRDTTQHRVSFTSAQSPDDDVTHASSSWQDKEQC